MILDTIRRWLGLGNGGVDASAPLDAREAGGEPAGREASRGGPPPPERNPGSGDGPPGGIPCEEALARIHEFMDGELEGVTADQVAEHFRVCTCCYPHLKLEESFRVRVRSALTRPQVPDHLRARILTLLDDEPGDGSDTR